MPKRSYPFSESFSTQYKVHVGQRELNQNGVFGNKYRQEVYEKTKNLLFNGAKAVMGKIWNADGDEKCTDPQPTEQPATPGKPKLLKGQTLIGQDGRLTRTTAQGTPEDPAGCCVCQKSQRVRTPCSQCDRPTCSSCSRQCSSCFNLCCSVCTIVDYSGRYDQVLCCGCSS